MRKTWYKYIGYYVEKTEKKVTATKKEKMIRACLPNEIVREARGKKTKLLSIIDKIASDNTVKHVIIITCLKELGETKEQIVDMYEKIINVAEIIVINHPELSTIDLHNNIIVRTEDEKKKIMIEDFLYKEFNDFKNGRKKIKAEEKFRKVFWAWQNYFIDTKNAIALTGLSKTTLMSLAREFMTSPEYRTIYKKEYSLYMESYEDKPVIGVSSLNDEEYSVLCCLAREIEGEWTIEQIEKICKENFNTTDFIAQDYIRLRTNYREGRTPIFATTKKYNKGPEYVEKLKKELAEIN